MAQIILEPSILLPGIMKEADSIAMRIISSLQVRPENIYEDINKVINEFDDSMNDLSGNNSNKDLGSYGLTRNIESI